MNHSYDISTGRPVVITMMLAWPSILEQLLLTLASYVDTAMVGSLGAGATAAVAINASSVWLITGLLSAIAVGYSVQVAHSIGAGEQEQAREIVRQAVMASAGAGIALMLLCVSLSPFIPLWLGADPAVLPDARRYLFFYTLGLPLQTALAVFSAIFRCMGDTRTPLLFNTGANLLNVLLNFLLIFDTRAVVVLGREITIWGAGLGVTGAAVATACSGGLAGLLLTSLAFLRHSPFQISLRDRYRPNSLIIRQAVRLAVPVALERITISSGQLLITRMVAGLGTVSLAANHVAVTAEGISYLPAQGIGFAATTLVGQSVGARDLDKARQYGRLSGMIGFLFSAAGGLFIFLLAVPLARIFSSDPQVVELAAQMLRIVAIAEPMFGASIVLSGALRGAGDTTFPFLIVLAGMWAVRVVLVPILLFAFDMGLAAAWIAMAADLMVRGIFCMLRFARINWEKQSRKMLAHLDQTA